MSVGLLSYIKAQSLNEDRIEMEVFMPFEAPKKEEDYESEEDMYQRMIDEVWDE